MVVDVLIGYDALVEAHAHNVVTGDTGVNNLARLLLRMPDKQLAVLMATYEC